MCKLLCGKQFSVISAKLHKIGTNLLKSISEKKLVLSMKNKVFYGN